MNNLTLNRRTRRALAFQAVWLSLVLGAYPAYHHATSSDAPEIQHRVSVGGYP